MSDFLFVRFGLVVDVGCCCVGDFDIGSMFDLFSIGCVMLCYVIGC